MAWLMGTAVIILALLVVLSKSRTKTGRYLTVRQHTRISQTRAKALPESEKAKLSAELRELALEQYDMANARAKDAGKNDSFAHQVGVLQSVSAALMNGEQVDRHREAELQMETMPFNKLPPEEGRRAISEYLVWKSFPDKADEDAFSPALEAFRQEILAESENRKDPFGFMVEMIYVLKCDWQRYIADHLPSHHQHPSQQGEV